MMQKTDSRSDRGQSAVIAALLIMVVTAGFLLYRNSRPAAAAPAEPVQAETETTTVTEGASTAAVTGTETTVTTAVTEAEPRSLYLEYLTGTLIPKYGLADDSGVLACTAQTGVAGAYLADLSSRGEDDLLVIRLETLDTDHAAAPVFEWYTLTDGTVTLLDSFSCKMPWTDLAVRYAQQSLFISACDRALNDTPESREYTELTVSVQNADLQTADMVKHDGEDNRPAAKYPADAALLLTVESDRTQTLDAAAARRYLLSDYTGLREMLLR
ncbi:MAG: hypothetical protein IKX57_07645 [Oscillospiraceae bacterium]|nr:hypothetical protein [Oscillospiraceae bacterium]